jgi:hypothetical protein
MKKNTLLPKAVTTAQLHKKNNPKFQEQIILKNNLFKSYFREVCLSTCKLTHLLFY